MLFTNIKSLFREIEDDCKRKTEESNKNLEDPNRGNRDLIE